MRNTNDYRINEPSNPILIIQEIPMKQLVCF